MKNSIFISSVFLLFSSMLTAQTSDTDTREKFVFGARAGINISNAWDKRGQDFKTDPKVGFAGGLFVGIPIRKWIGIQPEVLISQKGLKGSGTIVGFPYSFSRTLTYLAIPIQFQVKPIEYVTILAGPQFSYLLRQKNVNSFGDYSVEIENEFDNENTRRNMLGFLVGVDVNISHIVISGRCGWDLQSNRGDGSSETPRYKNQWLQMTVGVKI